MNGGAIEIRLYRGARPRPPFTEWLASLKDKRTVAAIQARLNRIRLGNFGDSKSVGLGVYELRIDFGPGYRIYYGREGASIVILLSAGGKRGQDRDIRKAQSFWKDYLHGQD